MSAILSTLTSSGNNITTEIQIGTTYTADTERWVYFQPRVTGLNANAAVISFRLEHTTNGGTVLAPRIDSFSSAKNLTSNTMFGSRALGPVLLATGEKLLLYALSSNSLDTSISASILVLDGCTLLSNQDKTGYSVTTISDKSGYTLSGTQTFNNTGSWAGNITGNLSGSVGSVTGNVGGSVGSVTGNVSGSVASVVGNIGGNLDGNVAGSVLSVTNPVTVSTNNDKSGYTLSSTQIFNNTGSWTGNLSGSVGSVTGNVGGSVASVTSPVTVGVNNDKTNYTTTTADHTSVAYYVWSNTERTLSSASDIASDIWNYSGIRSITDRTGFAIDSASISNITDAIWNEPVVNHDTSNTYGKYIDAAISSRLATSGYNEHATDFIKLKYPDGAIWIDTVNGSAGAVLGVNGTSNNPVNNMNDLMTLSTELGVRKAIVIGGSSITLSMSHDSWNFIGVGINTIDLGSQSVNNCSFDSLTITGTQGGTEKINCFNCTLGELTNLNIRAMQCDINGDLSIIAGSHFFNHCFASVVGAGTPKLNFESTEETIVGFRLYSGGLEVSNLSANHILKYDCPVGRLTIDADCSDAIIYIRGLCELTNNGSNIQFSKKCDVYTDTISSTVWVDSSSRTLTDISLGASDIWNYADRTLSDKSGFVLDSSEYSIISNNVWNNNTRTLSDFGFIDDIWDFSSRSINDKVGFSLTGGERTNIATSVWATPTRILSSASNVAGDIWGYSGTRSITDKVGFALTNADKLDISDKVWDEPFILHDISGTFGGRFDDTITSRLATANYINPTTEFDKLRYTNNYVYIDTCNGVSGTSIGDNGTPENPVNNLADAKTIADTLNYNSYFIVGKSNLTLISSHSTWNFIGTGHATIDLGDQDVGSSHFEGLTLTGGQGGTQGISCEKCTLSSLEHFKGKALFCGLYGSNSIREDSDAFFNYCYSSTPGSGATNITFEGTATTVVAFYAFSGGIEFFNISDNHVLKYNCISARLILGASNTGGLIYIRGLVNVTNTSTIPPENIIDEAQLEKSVIKDLVWVDTTSRTLTSYGTLTTDVWDFSSRALTDKLDFYLANDSITNNVLASSAITEIQNGLSTALAVSSVGQDVSSIKVTTDKYSTLIEQDGPIYRYTENSLENSPVGTGGFTSNDRSSLEEVEALIINLGTMIEVDGPVYRYTENSLENSPVGTGGFTANDRSALEGSYTLLIAPEHGLIDIDVEIDEVHDDILLIKAVTNKLKFSDSSDVKVTLDGEYVILEDNSLTSAKIATDAITSTGLATSAVTEIQTGLATQTLLSSVYLDTSTIKNTTNTFRFTGNDVKATLDNETVVLTDYSITNTKYSGGAIQASSFAADVVPAIQLGLATEALLEDVDGEVDAIRAVTDVFRFTGNDVKATLDSEKVTVESNEDKTGYLLSGDGNTEIVNGVWDNSSRTLTETEALTAQINSIKEKTDLLSFTGNDVKATLDSETVILTDNSITSSKYATDAITSSALAASAITEIQSGLSSQTTLNNILSDTSTIKTTTNKFVFVGNDVKSTLDNEQVILTDYSISNTKFASDSIDARVLKADAVTEIQDGLATQSTLDAFSPYFDAVKNKTDQLTFGNDGRIVSTLNGEQVTVISNLDKINYSLTSAYDSAKYASTQTSVDNIQTDITAIREATSNISGSVPTAAEIAAEILETPEYKIVTDENGFVTADLSGLNVTVDFAHMPVQRF